jgi:hypothetical protein
MVIDLYLLDFKKLATNLQELFILFNYYGLENQ